MLVDDGTARARRRALAAVGDSPHVAIPPTIQRCWQPASIA